MEGEAAPRADLLEGSTLLKRITPGCAVIQAQVGSAARSLGVGQSRNVPRAFGDDAQEAVSQERPGARGVKKILASGAALAG
jgi:hypothetical protein